MANQLLLRLVQSQGSRLSGISTSDPRAILLRVTLEPKAPSARLKKTHTYAGKPEVIQGP